MALPPGTNVSHLPHVTGVFNLVAFLAILVVTAILVIGIQESANFNTLIVIVKLTCVVVFLAQRRCAPCCRGRRSTSTRWPTRWLR